MERVDFGHGTVILSDWGKKRNILRTGRDVMLRNPMNQKKFKDVFGNYFYAVYRNGVLLFTRHDKDEFWTRRNVARMSSKTKRVFSFPKSLPDQFGGR